MSCVLWSSTLICLCIRTLQGKVLDYFYVILVRRGDNFHFMRAVSLSEGTRFDWNDAGWSKEYFIGRDHPSLSWDNYEVKKSF